MKPDYWRGLDFFDPSKTHPNVLIIGCGHIGSYLAFGLARMGVKDITVVDHDMVEPHNLPNQFFAESLVKDLPKEPSLYKVVALQQTVKLFIGIDINIIPMKIENAGISFSKYQCVMVAVDDMDVRKWIWEKVNDSHMNYSSPKFLVDARTGGEFANTYGISLRDTYDCNHYAESLHSNDKAAPLPCTGTSIIDVSFGVVADCIHKYREYAKHKTVIVTHTFHDYVIGTTSIMSARNNHSVKSSRVEETPGVLNGDNVIEPPEEPEI